MDDSEEQTPTLPKGSDASLTTLCSNTSTDHSASPFTTDDECSSIEDELHDTVIEVVQSIDSIDTIDYKDKYEQCKSLLDAKTEDFQKTLVTLTIDCENSRKECHALREKCEEMSNAVDVAAKQQETYAKIINEKDAELATQNDLLEVYRGTEQANRIHLKRSPDEIFKLKGRKKSGSLKQSNVNKCENESCDKEDTDLVQCSICSKYVCESCNEVPINKLKSVIKTCPSVYFICQDCSKRSKEIVTNNENELGKTEKDDNLKLLSENRLREDITRKIEVIKSMELAHSSLNKLVEDKDETIGNQKTIIDSLQKQNNILENAKTDLIDARKIISLKNAEISKRQEEAELIKTGADPDQIIVLNAQLESLKEANEILTSKWKDQTLITTKTELAFDTQNKLIASKSEIIENLKLIISQNKNGACSPQTDEEIASTAKNMTSQNSVQKNIPGFEESVICLSNIALHGLAVNGLLLWVDIQRRTTTSKEWKEKTMSHFTTEEITDAKNLLWDVCGENILGKLVKRQGPSKIQSEVEDIENAFNTLAEEEKMPLFIASSSMIMQTPHQLPKNPQPALKDIEDIMDAVMKKRAEHIDKKYDKSISKTDQGLKKIDGMIKNMESIERKIQNFEFERPSGQMFIAPTQTAQVNAPTLVNAPPSRANTPVLRPPTPEENLTFGNNNIQTMNPPKSNMSTPNTATNTQEQTWASRIKNTLAPSRPQENMEQPAGGWRQRLHLLHGEAGESTQGGSFSADVDIVAHNVAKNITAADLCNWLSQRGLYVKNCILLTTTDKARSLAFKITIDPKDFDRATKDPSIWPYRVGVRLFKAFNRTSNNNENRARQSNDENRNNRQNARDGGQRVDSVRSNTSNGRYLGQDGNRNDSRYDNYRRY